MSAHHAYRVTWLDSSSLRGWNGIEGDHTPATIVSTGWMVKQDKTAITLTTSISEHQNIMDGLTIPRCAITRITKLRHSVRPSDFKGK